MTCFSEVQILIVVESFSAPPSYEECMFGKMDVRSEDDNEYTGGDFEYAPKYPVYRI